MKHPLWKQRFLNNYKKYVAIVLSCIGLAFLIASFIITVMRYSNAESISPVSAVSELINFLLLALAYGYLFYGNLNGTSLAYRGMLLFIIYVLWDFGYAAINMFVDTIIVSSSGDPVSIVVSVVLLIGSIMALATGIFCYVRTRQYLTSRYAKYEMVRLWALLFMIFVILSNGLIVFYYAYFYYVTMASIDIFFSLLEPISMMLMSIVCFFSVLRLKNDY